MRTAHTTVVEALESRRLCAASLSKGVLTVSGSARDDTISFSVSKDQKLTIHCSRQTILVAVSAVKSVVIYGLYGNDLIDARNLPLKATVYGGDSNDTVYGSAFNDAIYGGDGDDNLIGGKGNDTLTGNGGKDRFNGGQGTNVYADLNAADGDKNDDAFGILGR